MFDFEGLDPIIIWKSQPSINYLNLQFPLLIAILFHLNTFSETDWPLVNNVEFDLVLWFVNTKQDIRFGKSVFCLVLPNIEVQY